MENDTGQMFAKGIISGWMIATMVWMIPSMESAKMWIIILITYLMALGDFTHIVVGSAEVSYLVRSEEHTSELQSLMRISYAVFCLKKKKTQNNKQKQHS